MLAVSKLITFFGALLVSVILLQGFTPVHQCYTPNADALDIGQCQLALLQFDYTPHGGLINISTNMMTKRCGNCEVTLATLDANTKIVTSLLSSLDAVRQNFELCSGHGTVVVDIQEYHSLTNLTLGLAQSERCLVN